MLSPQVDIVILNYNGKKFLESCIPSLLKCTWPNTRIYVLDNASTDDDVYYVQTNFPEVQIISNPLNNGYCAAYNLAFSACSGKYIVCLNNDVTVNPDWIEHLVALAETDENIAALQPKIVSYYDPNMFEYAGASGGMMDVYGFPFLRGRMFKTIEKDEGQYNDIIDIFWASGAAMFLRRSALDTSGFLDETIVHHMDEIDLCWRLRMHGFRVMVQPKSVINHIGGATIQTNSFKKVYWNHRNSIYMMLKNYGFSNLCTKVPVHIILDYVAIVQSLLTLNFTTVRGILSAHAWLLFNIPIILNKRKEVQQKRTVGDTGITPFLFRGSVVFAYFLQGKKTYKSLKITPKNGY